MWGPCYFNATLSADLSSTYHVKAQYIPADMANKVEIAAMMKAIDALGGADIGEYRATLLYLLPEHS